MKVEIYSEGGGTIGYGHLMRCAGLYDAFLDLGWQCEFVINGDESLGSVLEGRSFRKSRWDDDVEANPPVAQDVHVAVIDSYLASEAAYRRIASRASMCVFIDDYGRLEYPQGIVVRGGAVSHCMPHDGSRRVECLTGPAYHLLRREFWDVPVRGQCGSEINETLLTIGGGSSPSLLVEVARLMGRKFPHAKRNVILGRAHMSVAEALHTADRDAILYEGATAKTVCQLMLASDFAVTAGGQTLNELARCGTPCIAFAVSENQREHASGFHACGTAFYAGFAYDTGFTTRLWRALDEHESFEVRSAMSSRGPVLIDGQGPRRIAKRVVARIA